MAVIKPDNIKEAMIKDNRESVGEFFDLYSSIEDAKSNLSVIDPEVWYKTFPFEIVAVYLEYENIKYDPSIADVDTAITQYVYSLPIPPEAISTTMIAASQATATLDGVVEETSENKFWQISFQGTTGISSNRLNPLTGKLDTVAPATTFRETKKNFGLISGAIDKFASLSQSAIDIYDDFKNGENIEAFNKLFTTTPIFSDSAVDKVANGFYELHLFHRFLYAYSQMKDRDPERWVLLFRNFKDSSEWRVVLNDFRFTKTKENPYMYKYNISFKAWDFYSLATNEKHKDRFATGGDLNGLKTFTATGIASKIANLTAKVAAGPTALLDAVTGESPVI